MKSATCKHCDTVFTYGHSGGSDRKFCSTTCYRAHPKSYYDWAGARNHKKPKRDLSLYAGDWKSTEATMKCDICKSTFTFTTTRTNTGSRYCSLLCANKAGHYSIHRLFEKTYPMVP